MKNKKNLNINKISLNNNLSLLIDDIKSTYNINDDKIVYRLLELRDLIIDNKKKDISILDLIKFLNSAINYDEMQIWLLRKQMKGEVLTLEDKLSKFFELKSNYEILNLYIAEENYNQNNIDDIRKSLNNVKTYKKIPKK